MTEAERFLIENDIPAEYKKIFLKYNVAPAEVSSLMLARIKAKMILENEKQKQEQEKEIKKLIENEIEKTFDKINL